MAIIHKSYPVRYDVRPSPAGNGFQAYCYDTVLRKAAYWETYETRRREALELVKARIDQIYGSGKSLADNTREYRAETIESMLQRYLDDHYAVKISSRRPEKQKLLLRNKNYAVNRLCKAFGSDSVNSLDKEKMQAFINARIQDGSAPGSIKGDCELLAAAIRKIITNGRAGKILEKMKDYTIPKTRKRDSKWLKPEQVDKFIEALPHSLRFMVSLQYWCGARISEIRDLRWDQVNFSTFCLEYAPDDIKEGDKTGDGKNIYIGEEMTRTLYEMHKNAPKDNKGNLLLPWVFLNDSKKNKIDQAEFYREWNATCLALGGEFVKVVDGKTVQAWTSHDMRRARVTAQVKKGFDLKTISKQTGHHSIRMLEQYIKADSEDVKAMVDTQRKSDRELTDKLNNIKNRLKEVWEVETDETKKAVLEDIWKDI